MTIKTEKLLPFDRVELLDSDEMISEYLSQVQHGLVIIFQQIFCQ